MYVELHKIQDTFHQKYVLKIIKININKTLTSVYFI